MEIELKYILTEPISINKLFNDSQVEKIKVLDSENTLEMRAIYLDTENLDLMKSQIAFRIRYENHEPIATLKWGGSADFGLHIRGELNVPVDSAFLNKPTLALFKGSEIYDSLLKNLENSQFSKVMEMKFIRQEIRLDTKKSISVLSYDEGEILTRNGNVPIKEVELELYSGSEADMTALGEKLSKKYNLTPSNISKYQRGLELLGL